MIDWDSHEFHPVVDMPEDYTILDLSGGTWTPPKTKYSVGKYDELRPGLYSTELFSGERFLHIGIDIGAPEELLVWHSQTVRFLTLDTMRPMATMVTL